MSQLELLRKADGLTDLAKILGYRPQTIAYILYIRSKQPNFYEQFPVAKRSGGHRTIDKPCSELKSLQKKVSNLLQNCIEEIDKTGKIKSTFAHGFRRRHSILTNAAVHRNKRYVFNIDLEDFFGTINFGRVRGFFMSNRNFSLKPKTATLLAQIACFENKLPQGSPCSPVISNLIGHIIDVRLAALASKESCRYSRYADDITFSTNKRDFPESIAKTGTEHSWSIGKKLNEEIERSGFSINKKKTRMQYCDSRQEVTGLISNKLVNTREEYRKTARAMAESVFRTGKFKIRKTVMGAQGSESQVVDGSINQLAGILSFIGMVKNYNTQRLLKFSPPPTNPPKPYPQLSAMEKVHGKFLFYKNFYANTDPLILCEGKTDNVYLRAAIRRLAAKFPALAKIESGKINTTARFFSYSPTTARLINLSGGTGELSKLIGNYFKECSKYDAPGMQNPVIIVTDNDDGVKPLFGVINKAKGLPGNADRSLPFHYVGRNLYVVPTPLNAGGVDSKIEDLFDAATQAKVLNGKTFSADNNADSSIHYGKHVFAEQIVKKEQSTIDFTGFEPLLSTISKIINDYKALRLSGATTTP